MKKSLAVLGLLGLLMAVPVSASAALTSTQVNAIISLLQSFGASQSTIVAVKEVLSGDTNPTAVLEVQLLNSDVACVATIMGPCEPPYTKFATVQIGSKENEFSRTLTTSTGKVTFNDLPTGLYTVEIFSGNTIYKLIGKKSGVVVDGNNKVQVYVRESDSATPSITVISPNGGESFGNKDKIDVMYYGVNLSDRLDAYLYNDERGNMMTSISVIAGSHGTGKGLIHFDLSLNKIPAGQYRINLCDPNNSPIGLPGKDLCDMSDNYFTITSSAPQKPSVSILSPKGGDVWKKGEYKNIVWDNNFAICHGTGCRYPDAYIHLVSSKTKSMTVAKVNTGQGVFNWKVGSFDAISEDFLIPGDNTLQIEICLDKEVDCGRSDRFTITDSGTPSNLPPVIRTFYGPTTVKPYAAGTWQIRASDPEGKKLTYAINWGDSLATSTGSLPSNGSLGITHQYKKVGQYRIYLVVQDSDGAFTGKGLTVNVSSGQSATAGSASQGILERLGNWFSR